MRKSKAKVPAEPDMLDEYDFSNAVRGKFYKRVQQGTNIVVLEPDLARIFPNSRSVNGALRALVKLAERKAKVAA